MKLLKRVLLLMVMAVCVLGTASITAQAETIQYEYLSEDGKYSLWLERTEGDAGWTVEGFSEVFDESYDYSLLEIPAEVGGIPVTTIGTSAFGYNRLLKTVDLPNSIVSIEEAAFSNCSGLTGVLILPENLTCIGELAFAYTSGLTEVQFPAPLQTIGRAAFVGSGIGGRLQLPAALATLGESAFRSCRNLTGIAFPD